MDVWIILGINDFEFWMKGRVTSVGKAGIAFVDLEEGIPFMEVGVVVLSWQSAGNCADGVWYAQPVST